MAMSKLIKLEGIDFVEPLPEELNCPICFGLLQDPFLTACCGNHFCEPCANEVRQSNNKCPLCQDTPLNGIINKGLKRKVNELKVYCTHKQTGCSWVGNLGKLEMHVAADKTDGECQFVTVKCPVSTQCGARVLRKSLEDHVKNVCGYRQFTCKYCGYQSTYITITTAHYSACHQYPVSCPNNCSAQTHPRSSLSNHLAMCPEQEVACDFSEMGCKEKMRRRLLQDHMEDNVLKHQLNISQAHKAQNETIKQLEKQVTDLSQNLRQSSGDWPLEYKLAIHKERKIDWSMYLSKMSAISLIYPVAPLVLEVTFTIRSSSVVCKCGNHLLDSWSTNPYCSFPFYSHPNGYKLQLSAKLVRNCPKCVMQYVQSSSMPDGAMLSTSVLVRIQPVDGEHDHELKWPFKKQINVTLLNKRGDKCHHKVEASYEGNRKGTLTLKKIVYKLPQQQTDEKVADDLKLLKQQFDELCQASSDDSDHHPLQQELDFDVYQKFYELSQPNSLIFPFDDEAIPSTPVKQTALSILRRRSQLSHRHKTVKVDFEVSVCYL